MENRKGALSPHSSSDLYFPTIDNPKQKQASSSNAPSAHRDKGLVTPKEPTDRDRKDERTGKDGRKGQEDEEEGVEEGGEVGGAECGWSEERVGQVDLFGVPIVSLCVGGQERLCLAQISTSLLQDFSYNEIHNRRVALGITCLQCAPAQLEVLRRAGAMPVTSRRCGLITKREAERLVRSFIADVPPPRLPDNFFFRVRHKCGWGNEGVFVPARYNSSRAKCIKCSICEVYFSPNKFIFHCHPTPTTTYRHPDAANFNSWRRHLELVHDGSDERLSHAWEDVKAMFNGGSRKRISISPASFTSSSSLASLSNRMELPYDGCLHRNKATDEADSRAHTNSESQQETRNKNNTELPSWRKLHVPPSQSAMVPSQSTMPFSASSVSLVPPSLGSGAHPAFFATGLHGSMPPLSYGEFLRSMSRPYNIGAPSSHSLLPEMYRSTPAPNLASGMFGASPYPLSYLGYPPYFPPPAAMSQAKGINSTYFPPQLSDLRGFRSESRTGKSEQQDVYKFKDSHIPIPENSKATEEMQDDIIVDGEEEEKDKTRESNTSPQTAEHKASITKDRTPSQIAEEKKVKDKTRSEEASQQTSTDEKDAVKFPKDGDTAPGSDMEDGLIGEGEQKIEQNAKEKKCNENDTDNVHDKTGDVKEAEVFGSVRDSTDLQEQKLKASRLPSDTKSLLAIFEETEDVDTFIHLPIETLRILYKAAKKKSRTTEGELRKMKETQSKQRQKAEEVREQLSGQFYVLKQTIWAEVEKERKMISSLHDRLTETQKLTSQNYGVFSHLK